MKNFTLVFSENKSVIWRRRASSLAELKEVGVEIGHLTSGTKAAYFLWTHRPWRGGGSARPKDIVNRA